MRVDGSLLTRGLNPLKLSSTSPQIGLYRFLFDISRSTACQRNRQVGAAESGTLFMIAMPVGRQWRMKLSGSDCSAATLKSANGSSTESQLTFLPEVVHVV